LVTAVVTIPLLVVILLASRKTLSKTVIESIPNNYFEVTVTIIQRIISHIEDYAWAKTLEMIIMVVVYAIGFQIIGLPQALFISIIGGVLNIIPYFGPLLTIIPVAVAAYTGGGTEIFILGIIVLVLARIIDDAVLQTILVAKLVDVHPLIVLLVTLVGEQMLGIVGMIIAVPAYVVTKIVIEGMYEYLMALQRHELLHSEKNNEQNNT
jgi:predicted PurR-regulated permease PerM